MDAENRLIIAKRNERDNQALAIDRAVSGNAEPAPEPKIGVADLEFLIVGLADRQKEVEHEIDSALSKFEAESKQILGFCIERASEVYRERASDLVDSWHELDGAQMALGPRDLSWMHTFIPALEGMKGRQTHHSLATLFTGKDVPLVDGGAIMAELDGLLPEIIKNPKANRHCA